MNPKIKFLTDTVEYRDMSFQINTNHSASLASLHANHATRESAASLKKLSTGKKINGSADDSAGLAISSKLRNRLATSEKSGLNFQNTLSFLQVQEGVMSKAAEFIARAAELKHHFHSISVNQSDKENYDKEFREIQLQLREMQAQKFNGVSLFASGNVKSLASASNHSSILKVEESHDDQFMEIHRTGIFDSLFVERAPPSETESFNTAGNGLEYRKSIPLKGDAGTIKWAIDSISWPDKFTIMQGTETLFEEIVGDPGLPFPFGPNIAHFGDGSSGSGSQVTRNVEVAFSVDQNNPSKTIDLFVNKSNQVIGPADPTPLANVTWNADLEVIYESTQMSLTDGRLYSLGDFEFSEFSGFIDVMSNSLAQNGASQSRIESELRQLQSNQSNLEAADSRIADTDFALEATRMAKVNLLSQASAKMIGEANQLTKIALTIMGQSG